MSDWFDVVAVVTQPDRPVGRQQIITSSPVKTLATQHGLKILQPEKIKNNSEFLEELKMLDADLLVVVAYGKILPQAVLDAARFGSVNVHGSKLPKYRGASPIVGAILAGDASTAITIQKMVLKMDEGPILGFGPTLPISPDDTTESLSARMAETAAEVLPTVLVDYLEGKIVPTPQNDSEATYVHLLTKEDGVLDWNEPEEIIERKIRAYSPWPSAQTTIGGVVKILRARLLDSSNPRGVIGQSPNGFAIGKLEILELQPSGKNPMTGKAFLAGHPEIIGQSML